MKYYLKCIIYSLFIFLCLSLFACSNSTNSSNNNEGLNGQADTPKLLYWDNTEKAFKGELQWTPTTLNDQVLIGKEVDGYGEGFIDKVLWRIKGPEGIAEYTWGVEYTLRGNYTVNQNTESLTATLYVSEQSNSTYFEQLVQWASIDNVKVSVEIFFKTGAAYTLGTQSNYDYKGYLDDWDESYTWENLIWNYATGSGIGNNVKLNHYCGSPKGNFKVKNATVYVYSDEEGTQLEGTYYAETDWTDTDWLGSYSSSSSVKDVDFDPILLKQNITPGKTKFIFTFLDGEIKDTGLVWWRNR